MSIRSLFVPLLLALPLAGAVAAPPSVADDPESLPKASCSDLHFSSAFLSKYPKAPAACLEVRILDGRKYARFDGKVFLLSPEFVTVTFLNVAGDELTTFSFKPQESSRVLIDGKDVKYTDMKKGDKLTFWMPEDGLSVRKTLTPTDDHWRVLPPR